MAFNAQAFLDALAELLDVHLAPGERQEKQG